MAQQPQGTAPTYSYSDLPELAETFADSLHDAVFDGQMLRLTFTVSRMGSANPPNPNHRLRYTACRLVLTVPAAADLANRLNQLGAAIARTRTQAQSEGDTAKIG